MKKVEDLFENISGKHVLDVATGTGTFLASLKNGLRSYESMTGIDSKPETPQLLEGVFKELGFKYIQMDASQMTFPDSSFDTVAISNSLHHFQEPALVIHEMNRVLKPDGNMIIFEMFNDVDKPEQMTHVMLHQWFGRIDTALGIFHQPDNLRQDITAFLERETDLSWQYHDISEFSDQPENPLDAETINELSGIIDLYQKRALTIPDHDQFIKEGETLRQRLHEIGFLAATELLAIGHKN